MCLFSLLTTKARQNLSLKYQFNFMQTSGEKLVPTTLQ